MGGSSRIIESMVMPSTRTIDETRTVTSSSTLTPTHPQVVSHGVAQHQVVQELRAGQVYDTTVTVGEYLSSWLAGKQSLRPSTRLSYRCHIHQYLIPHLGHHRLTALRAQHLEAMYLAITSGNNQRERPVGPETLRRIHATCQSALNTRSSVGCSGATRRQPSSSRECSDPGEQLGMSAMRRRS